METTESGWWKRHGWTVAVLLAAFSFAFAIRTIWSYPVIARWGALYVYAGGSDSYYHSRVMQYIILTGHNLIHDPMLKYPIGGTNPREPLFDWMNAILGLIFAPFFGGNAVAAGAWFLDLQAPLWAALEVFPIYLIGREVSSRRTGLIAALTLPFLSASITSSTFGYANYLSFYTFMILVVVYSFVRTVKAVSHHRYVESYRDLRQIVPALRAYYRRDHLAVKWGVFTGVSLGALALSWQGYTYAILIVGATLLVAMIIERIRHVDSFALYVTTWIIGLVAIPMMMPYYLVQGDLRTFFDLPVLLFFGVLALMLPFLLMRDIPWVFSLPSLAALVGAAALGLKVFLPRYFADVVTGQGYFVKTLIYSTVAEAQPPSFDALVLGYGVATFFLAFVGLAMFVYLLVRHRFKRYHIALLVYGAVSLYLPITATKFFLVGAPAYALLAAESLHRALDVGSYPELRRTVASLSDRGSQFAAFRRAFKARHIIVLAIVVAIVLPNIWIAIDAGVPGNTKSGVAAQINRSIPGFLKLNSSEPAANYLGATGTELDTPNQYDSAAYNWLSHQDANVPEPQRPAFVSWWDYGFQAIAQGDHPSVADNFQNGIDPAGQFLLSQNESLAIAVLATTLLIAEETKTHSTHLPSGLTSILSGEGVNVSKLESLLADESADYATVVNHPDVYLPVDPSTITDDNAMYLAVSYYLAGSLSLPRVAQVYDSVQEFTGWSIRYDMVDSRLFPFSGTDTGIFYAPADLTGRVINSQGLPTTFYNVTVLATNNGTYPLGGVPAGVGAVRYNINYFSPFYNSMLYKTYIGYNGSQVGQAGGIPSLEGAAASDPLEPGWMLQHFQIVYRTAYYCAGVKNATNGSACMLPANLPTARALSKSTNGTLDHSAISYFQGGETMLAYYPGERLEGFVSIPGGAPDAGVRATVYDSWGIPHMTTVTGSNGTFSVVLPPGNDTLNLTTGTEDKRSQAGTTVLKSIAISVPDSIGYSFNAPLTVERFTLAPATFQGTVYWNTANNSSFKPTDAVVPGAQVVFTAPGGRANLSATTDAAGSYRLPNVPPGNYTFRVHYQGRSYNGTAQLAKAGATVNASVGLSPGSISGTVDGLGGVPISGGTVTLTNASGIQVTATSSSTGAYRFSSLGPGNYTLLASVANTLERSPRTPATIGTAGQSVTVALVVRPMTSVSVEVLSHSTPMAGIAVRFSPTLSFQGYSATGLRAFAPVEQNGTVAITGSDGDAIAALPTGNYSVYALGYVGGTVSAALGTLTVSGSGVSPTLTVSLVPAVTLSGTVSAPVSGGSSAVVAFSTNGGEVLGQTLGNGSFSFRVPAGSYTVLALQGTTVPTGSTDAALARVNLSGPLSLSLAPTPAAAPQFAVYANVTTDTTIPVANATITVSEGPSGPSVTQTAGANGSVGFYLPSVVPGASGGYCVGGTAPGFVASQLCGIAPTALGALSTYRLSLAPVPVTVSVVGIPTGTSVTVNVTAESPTAVDRSYSGGPRFSFDLPSGLYQLTAYASADGGAIVYAAAAPLPVAVPFGAGSKSFTLPVLSEILAHGTLSLPSGTTAANTSVTLASPVQDVTVNGTDYLAGFRISVGGFTASSNATGTLGKLSNLTAVTVVSGGTILPKLVLNHAGVKLTGSLVTVGGKALTLNGTATLSGAGGSSIRAAISKGRFSVLVPSDHNFTVHANITVRNSGTNGSFRETWSTVAGAVCSAGSSSSSCSVAMTSVRDLVWLNGTVERSAASGPTPAALRIIGPYPSTNLSVLGLANGSFSLHLLPGTYYLYALPTDGSPFAGFATALAAPGPQPATTISLVPATTDQVTVSGSGAAGQTIGVASLTVTGLGGTRVSYSGISPGTSLPIALPAGTYKLRAGAPGTLNGIDGNATARATVTIGPSGNLATRLALAVPVQAAVTATLTGPHESNVTAGESVTFSFSVRSSGNTPVTVRPVGSPAFWSFNFSFSNVTLTPGGPLATGEVRITVPDGTPVEHAPVAISFELANNTVVGSVLPAPTVRVAGYNGIALGHATGHPTSVGSTAALLPFYLRNSGNVPEEVEVAVSNAPSLARIGWSFTFGTGASNAPLTVNLSAGTNQTYDLNLTFTGTAFIAPQSVTFVATLVNVTHGPTASLTIPVAVSKVQVPSSNGSPVTVTGPQIGSSSKYLAEWELLVIALVPAIVLLALVVARQWWTTRRWSRW